MNPLTQFKKISIMQLLIAIALVALAALLQPRVKVPEPALVAVAAVAGLVLFS